MIIVEVDKILSYQTQIGRRGHHSYAKPSYRAYKKLIGLQLGKLETIKDNRELEVTLHFNCNDKRVGDLDNITKCILDTLEDYDKLHNDRYITKLNLSKSFGHKHNSIEISIEDI